jgi:hypothetical protein
MFLTEAAISNLHGSKAHYVLAVKEMTNGNHLQILDRHPGCGWLEERLKRLLMFFKAYGSSTKDSRSNKLHEELRAVQKHCAEAYRKDVDLYRNSGAAKGTSMNFEAWMSKFGIFYPASRKEQDRVEKKLHELGENPMEGAAIALASMRLAAETKHYHLGYSFTFPPLAHFHKL